tara:strand:+ start:429 stop:968 length:540 start_codon:yes stop_codon:yes gene_type:complete
MLSNNSDFTLDLAFNPALDSDLDDLLDESLVHLLTHSQPWQSYLETWIQMIRSDINLTCPIVVREASNLSLGLQFTDDLTIADMNNIWRNINLETDVLSFPIIDSHIPVPEINCIELGDIVVSVTTAKRQANEMGHGLDMELKWLVSHGLLHLLGWDHPNSNSLKRMLNCQEELILRNN